MVWRITRSPRSGKNELKLSVVLRVARGAALGSDAVGAVQPHREIAALWAGVFGAFRFEQQQEVCAGAGQQEQVAVGGRSAVARA